MIKFLVDISGVLRLSEELEPKVNRALADAVGSLAIQAHGHLLEEVQQKLHSTRDQYVSALSFEQVSEDTWVITLDRKATWIEEGMPEHSMVEGLLRSPKAKVAADGSRYLVVPFEHSKAPSQQTKAAQDLTQTIRRELERRNIPYTGVETDKNGKPRLGLLHRFDINSAPVKTGTGPGQGHGPVGGVKQGSTGTPWLQGVRVYQKQIKLPGGKTRTARSIMTFRTVSSKHAGGEKWRHPGLDPRNFFQETEAWALNLWVTKIAPKVLKRVIQDL